MRINLQGGFEMSLRLIKISLLIQNNAQIVMNFGISRIQREILQWSDNPVLRSVSHQSKSASSPRRKGEGYT